MHGSDAFEFSVPQPSHYAAFSGQPPLAYTPHTPSAYHGPFEDVHLLVLTRTIATATHNLYIYIPLLHILYSDTILRLKLAGSTSVRRCAPLSSSARNGVSITRLARFGSARGG